jgi:threonylcarbamoyladenosine tRNA methylthiotransferase MtaB
MAMKAVVFTLGCKVNEVESASIMTALERAGWEVSDKLSPADIYVLNTCAVTREAEKKSRQLVARAKKYNPQAKIYVCGCASEKDEKAYLDRGVTFVCGARDKGQVVQAILGESATTTAMLPPKQTKTRAFIKIEDGCNNFCSYCIIPYLRGRVNCRSIKDILGEIWQCGAHEVVLTGINISAYQYEGNDLTDLMHALKNCNKRIRLGSVECRVIDERFLQALRELPDFAPQFHLSLQSGSNAVLKAMNRRYTREEYIQKCNLIYQYFPDAAITTDIIAGFAGETEQDFSESLSIISEVGMARVHAFAYSPRKGTKAYGMPDVPDEVKNRRLHALLAEGERARQIYTQKFLSKNLSFIAEERHGAYTVGYTQNYIKVYVEDALPLNEMYSVTLTALYEDGALATPCQIG